MYKTSRSVYPLGEHALRFCTRVILVQTLIPGCVCKRERSSTGDRQMVACTDGLLLLIHFYLHGEGFKKTPSTFKQLPWLQAYFHAMLHQGDEWGCGKPYATSTMKDVCIRGGRMVFKYAATKRQSKMEGALFNAWEACWAHQRGKHSSRAPPCQDFWSC